MDTSVIVIFTLLFIHKTSRCIIIIFSILVWYFFLVHYIIAQTIFQRIFVSILYTITKLLNIKVCLWNLDYFADGSDDCDHELTDESRGRTYCIKENVSVESLVAIKSCHKLSSGGSLLISRDQHEADFLNHLAFWEGTRYLDSLTYGK